MWLAGDASALTDSMSHQPLTSEQLSHTQQWRKQKKHLKATIQQKRKEYTVHEHNEQNTKSLCSSHKLLLWQVGSSEFSLLCCGHDVQKKYILGK